MDSMDVKWPQKGMLFMLRPQTSSIIRCFANSFVSCYNIWSPANIFFKLFWRTHFWNTKASCATFFLVPSRMPSPEMVAFFTPKNHPNHEGDQIPYSLRILDLVVWCFVLGGSFRRYLRCWIGFDDLWWNMTVCNVGFDPSKRGWILLHFQRKYGEIDLPSKLSSDTFSTETPPVSSKKNQKEISIHIQKCLENEQTRHFWYLNLRFFTFFTKDSFPMASIQPPSKIALPKTNHGTWKMGAS